MSTDTVHYSQCLSVYFFITLDRELDIGGKLQKRICYKINVRHDPVGYWESNRELVRVKLMKKGTQENGR
jgi:hypothetical protein